ncbi:hypothetical protein [Spiroplasma chrysopicola]|uniref:Uncharacterized protein n=1 Tax=Spiroplasma chrysopicola DF-1 TaxID=1276227 RepID=R4UFF2_9MOLU|nr:hypothetical protein [Spiroplasma chrysopicola]AGM24875.1 hypothetical protein SCHRY_v1c02900 [Spiroplasma chrysopicola DF-1]
METRIEKFYQLRERIKKEIELDQEINQANQVITNYMNKLNLIDNSFFVNVKSAFEQEFNWEKVYLDKNPDEQPYPPNFKYDLQNLLEQVQRATNINATIKPAVNQEATDVMHNILISETLLNKPTFQKYQAILEAILEDKIVYRSSLEQIRQENSTFKINSSNIDFAVVAQMRKNDERPVNIMLKDVNNIIEEKHNVLLTAYRKVKPKYKILLGTICSLIVLLAIILGLFFLL